MAFLLAAGPVSRAADATVMVEREIAFLEFTGGSPLSPAERQQAAAIVEGAMREHPAEWERYATLQAKILAAGSQGNPRLHDRLRAATRLDRQVQPPESDPLRAFIAREVAIVQAHDPAIIWDPARKRLITTVAVAHLLDAGRTLAPLLGVPAPQAGSMPAVADHIRAAYPIWDERMRDWMSHAEANLPYAVAFLSGESRTREAVRHNLGAMVLQGTTPADRDMRLAQVLASAGANGAAQGAGGGGAAGMMEGQRLLNNQMMGAVRSFSPRCNVYTGAAQANAVYCQPH